MRDEAVDAPRLLSANDLIYSQYSIVLTFQILVRRELTTVVQSQLILQSGESSDNAKEARIRPDKQPLASVLQQKNKVFC